MIDGHNDLPFAIRLRHAGDLDAIDLTCHQPHVHTDLPRLRAGGVTGQFWAAFVPSTLPGPEAVSMTLEQIDLIHRMIERYPETLQLARSADEVRAATHAGRIASLIGVEGGHSIDESLGVLRTMHALGVRYLTLTHNDNNPWADSATDDAVLGGLSGFGEAVVAEMNRIGMMVDLSHVSADVMRHALRVTSAPVIFSHSSARQVCDVTRNVPDDVLAALAVNGGVCMVTFVAEFVSPACAEWMAGCKQSLLDAGGNPRSFVEYLAHARTYSVDHPRPRATIDDVVAHVEHVREVAGVDHIGIGGDYDGCDNLPVGLDDVGGYPRLFAALAERGWSQADLDLVRTGNIMRVLADTQP